MRKLASISSICDVNPRLPASLRSQEELPVSFVPMSAVHEAGSLDSVETRQLRDVAKGYTYFEEGDVLVAKITPCMENGKVAQAAGLPHPVGFGSTEFHVLRPGPDVDGRYLFHMVWNPFFRSAAAGSMTGSAGQRRVPVSFFARIKIPVPPLPEQRRIAAILDKADAVRRKRQQTLDLADQFLRSAFLDMFGDPVTNPRGWPVSRLGDLLVDIEGGWSAQGEDRAPKAGEKAVLKVSAVTSGSYRPDECKAVPDTQGRGLVVPAAGDVLFSRANTRELVAATCLVDRAAPDVFLPDKLWRLVPDIGIILGPYLRFALSTVSVRSLIRSRATGTSGSMLNVSMAKLRAIPIPLPDLQSQEQFGRLLTRLHSFEQRERGAGAACETLGSVLLQRAFSGGL